MLFGNKREWTNIYNIMDESQDNYAKLKKPDPTTKKNPFSMIPFV